MSIIKSIYVPGYKYVNKQGLEAEVVEYNGRKNILVRLSDGFVGNTTSTQIKNGMPFSTTYGKISVGDVIPTKSGDAVEVIEYLSHSEVRIKWLSDGTEKWVWVDVIKDGILKHPLTNKVYIGQTLNHSQGLMTRLEIFGP